MADLNKIYLYRMTHIANVPHILEYGVTHRNSGNSNPHFVPIGDPSLISRRDEFILDNGRRLGEYIPFYFGTRMPMLYVIQKGYNNVPITPANDIVYIVTSVQQVINSKQPFIYTDGHAVDSFTAQFDPGDVYNIENQVDFQAVKILDWKDPRDLDLKRRMQAEFLVLGDLSFAFIRSFVALNEGVKRRMMDLGVKDDQIRILTNAYF